MTYHGRFPLGQRKKSCSTPSKRAPETEHVEEDQVQHTKARFESFYRIKQNLLRENHINYFRITKFNSEVSKNAANLVYQSRYGGQAVQALEAQESRHTGPRDTVDTTIYVHGGYNSRTISSVCCFVPEVNKFLTLARDEPNEEETSKSGALHNQHNSKITKSRVDHSVVLWKNSEDGSEKLVLYGGQEHKLI